ncbi:TonB-dependent receptor-like protein [Novosphingobium sp. Rr 2-17]|uniref:TonB-dependent receptor n=1 Tax=Novosphingobium sp. Rr 2-17 TaxID=555793 RepID=UPI0002698F0C|nr:TonB-dependent receptor [Novosphingobium sp. Rr 2-17]EIZ78162.1 TonB-dependent receptor-like protein [Novosphingobium sp. Rr 2-17]
MSSVLLRSALLAATASIVPATASAADATPAEPIAADASSASAATEIVVTGRYKGDDVSKVPIAITALTSQQIDSVPGDFNIRTLQRFSPSLSVQGFSVRNQTITIRGLGTNSGQANEGLDQGVGIYIDGVYYARTGTAVSDLLDVQSLQVLRGPQGTLFGKNTVAGAIDIRTREPSFTPEGSFSLTYGNYNYVRAQASASVPISDKLAIRIAGSSNVRDGTIQNTTYNDKWDNRHSYSGKLDVLWKPTDTTKVRVIGDYGTLYGTIGFTTVAGVLSGTLANGTTVARDFYAKAASVGYTLPDKGEYDRTTDIDGNHNQKLNTGGASLHVEQELGNAILTSITAYRFWNYFPHYDGDQTGADVYSNSTVGPHQKQFSQELRISSAEPGPLQYTAGLYYFWQKQTNYQNTTYGKDAAKWLVSASAPDALLDGLEANSITKPETNSYAAFGQLTWTFTPKLSVTGGLRYTWEKKSGSYSATQDGDVADVSTLGAYAATAQSIRNSYAPSGGDYYASKSGGNVSGLLTLNYQATDNASLYATYSRGYKSAAINLVRQSAGLDVFIKPEKVDAFELGLKTQLFENKLTFNTALFWTNVNNYQANIYDTENRVTYLSNAGKVRSRGVEVDIRANPVEGLTFTASGAFTDAKYVRYTNALCPYAQSYQSYCDISGQRLSGVSKWVGSIWGEYAQPIGGDKTAYVGGDVAYRSSFYSTVNDDPYAKISAYTLVGARVGVRADKGNWDVSLWASNLFNEKYWNTLSVSSTVGIVQGVLGDPRTYGVTLRTNF